MTLSPKEFDALIEVIPMTEVSSPDFLISDRGVNIAGSFRGDPENMDIDVMIGGESVELSKFQRVVLNTCIFAKTVLPF